MEDERGNTRFKNSTKNMAGQPPKRPVCVCLFYGQARVRIDDRPGSSLSGVYPRGWRRLYRCGF